MSNIILTGCNSCRSIAVGFIIWSGLFGYGGWVTRLLSQDFWCPLGRLVYCAYLVHPMLMYALYYSGNKPADWYDYRAAMDVLAFYFAAFGVALAGHLLIEKPMINLQKILLPAK